MITENHLGKIKVSHSCICDIVGKAVTNCFGVADMNTGSAIEELVGKVFPERKKRNNLRRGIAVKEVGNRLIVNIHIAVTYGTNISAVSESVAHKVRFALHEYVGAENLKINVYVDKIKD